MPDLQQILPKIKSTNEKVSVPALKDFYVSQVPKNPNVIIGSSSGPERIISRGILRFTTPLCDYSRSPSTRDL
jgi:hypothetical protein